MSQPFIVENRPGASSMLGADFVAKSAPDGYVLMFAGNALTVARFAYKKVPFDFFKDFSPIATVGELPLVFVTSGEIPVRSISELAAYAKANPGKINIGILGYSGGDFLAAELLRKSAGADWTYVVYKAGVAALPDLLQGRIQVLVRDVASVKPHVEAGKLRILATTTSRRVSSSPDLPTMAELGFPDFDVSGWFALYAPAGTQPEIINLLEREIGVVMKKSAVQEHFRSIGVEPGYQTAAQTAAHLRREEGVFGKLMVEAGVVPQ
jgi:tripartite-type tricarboxylate transporter receptor subunit TctC